MSRLILTPFNSIPTLSQNDAEDITTTNEVAADAAETATGDEATPDEVRAQERHDRSRLASIECDAEPRLALLLFIQETVEGADGSAPDEAAELAADEEVSHPSLLSPAPITGPCA